MQDGHGGGQVGGPGEAQVGQRGVGTHPQHHGRHEQHTWGRREVESEIIGDVRDSDNMRCCTPGETRGRVRDRDNRRYSTPGERREIESEIEIIRDVAHLGRDKR